MIPGKSTQNILQRGFQWETDGFTFTPVFKGHSYLSEESNPNSVEEPENNTPGILLVDFDYGIKLRFNPII